MKLRIAVWTGVGALWLWSYGPSTSATSPPPLGIGWTLIYLTCPIALVRHLRPQFLFCPPYECCYVCVGRYGRGNHSAPLETRLISS
jgi:hypothetical protein